jgi:heme-degrading monooxygenase HmoA
MITLINVFEIDAGDVDRFLEDWRERARFMSRQPGFRSLRLHRAMDADSRFQVVNVADWDNAEALQAATSQDFFQQSAQRSMQLFAVTAHPAIYRVVIEANAE